MNNIEKGTIITFTVRENGANKKKEGCLLTTIEKLNTKEYVVQELDNARAGEIYIVDMDNIITIYNHIKIPEIVSPYNIETGSMIKYWNKSHTEMNQGFVIKTYIDFDKEMNTLNARYEVLPNNSQEKEIIEHKNIIKAYKKIIEEVNKEMKKDNLRLLQEKSEGFKCSNCKTIGNKLIAESITISGQYYVTCTKCGNVEIAKESLNKDGNVTFILNATSQTETPATKILMNDAMKSYEAIGLPVVGFVTAKEAERHILKEEIKKELLAEQAEIPSFINRYKDRTHINMDKDFTEDKCDCEEPYEVCACHEEDVVEDKTYMVVTENIVDAIYNARSLTELQNKIERDFAALDGIKIFEIAREINIEHKIELR